jgi:hypothetical protein
MFDPNQSKPANATIKYNYSENRLYANYKKTPKQDQYIEMPYPGTPSFPNLSLGDTLYNTSKIYVYGGKSHPIKDLDYDGELVIEHTPITNWTGKVYTCIPLKTTNGIADSVVDQIISMTGSQMVVSINKLLQQSANTKAVIYNDTGFFSRSNTVIVCLNPLHIRSSLEDFHVKAADVLFAGYNPKYQVVNVLQDNIHGGRDVGIKESFIEGLNNKDKNEVLNIVNPEIRNLNTKITNLDVDNKITNVDNKFKSTVTKTQETQDINAAINANNANIDKKITDARQQGQQDAAAQAEAQAAAAAAQAEQLKKAQEVANSAQAELQAKIDEKKREMERCPLVPQGIPDTDVYISCQPSDVSTKDVQSFNMPLTSDMIEENKSTKIIKNTLSLFTIIFVIGFVSYIFPLIYESLVIGDIVEFYKKHEQNIEQRKSKVLERISTMDIILSAVVLTLSFGMISDGATNKYYIEKSIGMLIGAIFILGWYMISNKRTNAYNRGLLDSIGSDSNSNDALNIQNANILTFLTDMVDLLGRNISAIGGLLAFLIILVFLPLYYSSKPANGIKAKVPESVSWFVLWYGIVFSIYIVYLIDKDAIDYQV